MVPKSKCLKHAGNKFSQSGFTRFCHAISCKIQIASIFGHCMCFILKICQIIAGISMHANFTIFLHLIFGGFLLFGPTVRRRRTFSNFRTCSFLLLFLLLEGDEERGGIKEETTGYPTKLSDVNVLANLH